MTTMTDPRQAAVAAILANKALSRRERFEAVAAMGLKMTEEAGEFFVRDKTSIVFTTAKSKPEPKVTRVVNPNLKVTS